MADKAERTQLAQIPRGGRNGFIGAAGEHYVLYRLHRSGYLAALSPRNAPTVDILVLDEAEGMVATVQVKTRLSGSKGGWVMSRKHETIASPTLLYAFVDLAPEHPQVWLVPSARVAQVVRESHAAWLAGVGTAGQRKDSDMRQLRLKYAFEVPSAPHGWMDEYKEAWGLLGGRG